MEPTGRARVNANDPRAFGVCDRCGTWNQHEDLQWQFQWAGTRLFNTNLLVCDRCLDVPSEFLRTITLPPDPISIRDARPEPFTVDEDDPLPNPPLGYAYLLGSDGAYLLGDDDGDFLLGSSA